MMLLHVVSGMGLLVFFGGIVVFRVELGVSRDHGLLFSHVWEQTLTV
jgi:hypothetical protein